MVLKNFNRAAGVIFDIKKYAIHDGPGIRTTVFLKGCPLRCRWCHNPESWSAEPEMLLRRLVCTQCGQCVRACPNAAISLADGNPQTDAAKCVRCGTCIAACPAKARELAGRSLAVDELLREIEKDTIFYDGSGGGVTLSGGEPLMQAEFTFSLLEACKERQIHTALDTCCCGPKEILMRLAEVTDVFLCDIKHMDSTRHKQWTGVENELILENIMELSNAGNRVIIRVPVVPGFNDEPHDMENIALFARKLKTINEIDLLPYHSGGFYKAQRLGHAEALMQAQRPGGELLLSLRDVIAEYGFNVKIGG